MMFFEIRDTLQECTMENLHGEVPTVGFVTGEELPAIGRRLGIDEDAIEASRMANPAFRTGVDVRAGYTFTELRIVNSDGHEDYISIFILKNLLLVVDVIDEDGSTKSSFLAALRRYPGSRLCTERLICYFIEGLLSDGNRIGEDLRNELTEMEESIVNGTAGKDFNISLLDIKKRILRYYNYYGQMMDIAEVLEENDNELLEEDNLIYITNLVNKVSRLRDDMNSLSSNADHIQDAYTALLDQRMNSTMKVFTVITTIFFPLTIIVGWYGMNFISMPELYWKYGYVYVIVLSICVVTALVHIGRRKKWF